MCAILLVIVEFDGQEEKRPFGHGSDSLRVDTQHRNRSNYPQSALVGDQGRSIPRLSVTPILSGHRPCKTVGPFRGTPSHTV